MQAAERHVLVEPGAVVAAGRKPRHYSGFAGRRPAADTVVDVTTSAHPIGTLRSRVVLAILVAVFGFQAGALSFGALFLVCGIGTCPANGQLTGDSNVGLGTALAAGALLGVPFLIPYWARPRTRWITAAVVAGALFLVLATIIILPQSTINA